MAKIDLTELHKFQTQLQQMATPAERQRFYEDCLKELAARFLRKVIKRTPVGNGMYEPVPPSAKPKKKRRSIKEKPALQFKRIAGGGTLRRGWEAHLKDAIRVHKIGSTYQIELVNNTEYASYVEYGHRQTPGRFVPAIGKRLKESWVEGQFCMTISAREVEGVAPAILQRKIQRYLEEKLNGK
jgi:hypothetical protein|nr:MAG TPA: type I neck protein [Caudoviricetes sp.]